MDWKVFAKSLGVSSLVAFVILAVASACYLSAKLWGGWAGAVTLMVFASVFYAAMSAKK